MLIQVTQEAPEGSVFARFAFDSSLGQTLPFKVDGEVVGHATLIGAVPSEQGRSVELTWRVEEVVGDFFVRLQRQPCSTRGTMTLDAWVADNIEPDEYLPPDAFNPQAAIDKLRRAGSPPMFTFNWWEQVVACPDCEKTQGGAVPCDRHGKPPYGR